MDEEKVYHSIDDMRRRRKQLKKEIAATEKEISHLWRNLFHKHGRKGSVSRMGRIGSVVSTGVSVVDGALLVWKLYRRFKR
ncbi:MAG: hypothetical protein LUI08_06590 [Prevotella sp.]|nr:hypothetical protein [Prevotella sp.]